MQIDWTTGVVMKLDLNLKMFKFFKNKIRREITIYLEASVCVSSDALLFTWRVYQLVMHTLPLAFVCA